MPNLTTRNIVLSSEKLHLKIRLFTRRGRFIDVPTTFRALFARSLCVNLDTVHNLLLEYNFLSARTVFSCCAVAPSNFAFTWSGKLLLIRVVFWSHSHSEWPVKRKKWPKTPTCLTSVGFRCHLTEAARTQEKSSIERTMQLPLTKPHTYIHCLSWPSRNVLSPCVFTTNIPMIFRFHQ